MMIERVTVWLSDTNYSSRKRASLLNIGDLSPLVRFFAYTIEFSFLPIDYRFLLAAYGILIQPSTD